MEEEKKSKYPWENLDTNTILLPSELLVYYLYKYRIDVKNKKDSVVKEDIANIKEYGRLLDRGGSSVSETN